MEGYEPEQDGQWIHEVGMNAILENVGRSCVADLGTSMTIDAKSPIEN